MSVNPKVIETPFIAGIAMDGIEVKALARITVRANIDRLVGGAGEDTVIARVGEGVVSTIGSSQTHKQVLENPDSISHTVLAKGLDAGTALKFYRLILLMLILVKTLVQYSSLTKLRLINELPKLKLKNVVQWLLPLNKK